MEWKRNKKTMLRSQGILLPLIVLAVLLAILAFSSASKPAYAAPPTPEWISPGEGGGNPPPPPQISGQIFNARTGDYAVGVKVYIGYYTELGFRVNGPRTTDGMGYFSFDISCLGCSTFQLSVNGYSTNLGLVADDNRWCQWSNWIVTDSCGRYFDYIYLSPSSVVKVIGAAMYSHSAYATLRYRQETYSEFYHSVSFTAGSLGISNAYMSSTVSRFYCACTPSSSIIAYQNNYGLAYFDASCNKYYAGVTPKAGEGWGTLPTTEYIADPSKPDPAYCETFTCTKPGPLGKDYTESGSTTWSVNLGIPLGILFEAYGQSMKIDVTVKSVTGHTDTLGVDCNISGSEYTTIQFKVYKRTGEIHIWETGWYRG